MFLGCQVWPRGWQFSRVVEAEGEAQWLREHHLCRQTLPLQWRLGWPHHPHPPPPFGERYCSDSGPRSALRYRLWKRLVGVLKQIMCTPPGRLPGTPVQVELDSAWWTFFLLPMEYHLPALLV